MWDGVAHTMIAAALTLALAGGVPAHAPPPVFDRVCESRAEGGKPEDVHLPDARSDVFAGRATIAFARTAARRLSTRRPRPWILKTPVMIRAGAPVVIRVAARDRRHVALDFDQSRWTERDRTAADGQASVRFHACPPETKRFVDGKPLGEWTGYPGGLIVERPRCVTFEFLEEGRPTVRRRLGIGTRCR
jgi:hypothetical protein